MAVSKILPFVLCMGFLLLFEITWSAYLRSTITTIERRFQLSSTQSSLITSGFQIGNLSVIVLVSYFGKRCHRPRFIGIGGLLLFAGFFICCLPQFLGGRYEPNTANTISKDSGNQTVQICDGSDPADSLDANCEADSGGEGESSSLFYLIIVGLMICGVGGAPVQPLGYAYVDDYTEKHESAFYIGILQTIGLVGPAAGYILGSISLKLWVDVFWIDTSQIEITPRDPAWVGAWWLGIFIGSFTLLLMSLPFFCFPREMETPKSREEDVRKEKEEKIRKKSQGSSNELSLFLGALKSLVTNTPYMLLITIWTLDALKLSGWVTFIAKYLETAFGKSASSANMLIGTLNLPFLIFGTAIGSVIVKKYKFGRTHAIKMVLFASICNAICYVPLLFLGCDTIETAGINRPYPGSESIQLQDVCNAGCGCPDNIYDPVCGPGDLTYVSACHAGCSEIDIDDMGASSYNYTSCACVDSLEKTVRPGRCKNSNCGHLAYVVVALNAFSTLISGASIPCSYILMLTSLSSDEKSFGIGMCYFTFRLLAWIPGPIMFGKIIDRTCMLWTTRKCSSASYCSIFDSASFRISFFLVVGAIKLVSTLLQVVLYKNIKKSEKKQKYEEKEELMKAENDTNGYSIKDKEKESII